MIVTYKYRLRPSRKQHAALDAIVESQRQLYNAALEERIDAYRKQRVKRTYMDQTRGLTEWRQSDPDARGVPANLQRATLKRVDDAYTFFLNRMKAGAKAGFPRFRGKGRCRSFGFRQFSGITFEDGRLRFKGMPGGIRVHMHRPLPGDVPIRSCDFRRDTKGWAVSFAIHQITPEVDRTGRSAIGIDLGVSHLATLSDGTTIPNIKAGASAERHVRVADRSLSRKMRGSHSREKARKVRARCHAKVARRRANHLHQVSAALVKRHDLIAIEALNVIGLASGPFATVVRDASWGMFISMLQYKAARAGIRLVGVDPHGTTQDCSACGLTVAKNIKERWHDCPRCHLSIDRDINAARNVLLRAGVGPGLRNVADWSMRAGGNIGLDRGTPINSRLTCGKLARYAQEA